MATGEPGVTIVLPAVRHLAASVRQSCVKCDWKAVFWLNFVEAGILQGLSAEAEVQNLYLQLWELKILAELLGKGSELPVDPEGFAGGFARAGSW